MGDNILKRPAVYRQHMMDLAWDPLENSVNCRTSQSLLSFHSYVPKLLEALVQTHSQEVKSSLKVKTIKPKEENRQQLINSLWARSYVQKKERESAIKSHAVNRSWPTLLTTPSSQT